MLAWLEGLPRFSRKEYNLYRTNLLLQKFVPAHTFDIIFITGSKGKGTVAATLATILRRAGIATGLFTSPHLTSITERVNAQGIDISVAELAQQLQTISQGLPQIDSRYGGWIYTEVLLTAALMWFQQKGVGTVVVESGLGGRLDPGNVFRRPRATCVSNVTLEHQGILGSTIREIAAEKAGVIKPSIPVVTAAQGEALTVIQQRAVLLDAPVLVYGQDFGWNQQGERVELQLPQGQIEFSAGYYTPADKMNRAMAACLASLLPGVSHRAICQGITADPLPGRFELFWDSPTFVLDVAHTPEGVDNLLAGLEQFKGKKISFVAGFLSDKSAQAMVNSMARRGRVYCAPVADARSYDVSGLSNATQTASITAAVRTALPGADVVCVTGSFAAVREARTLLSKGI